MKQIINVYRLVNFEMNKLSNTKTFELHDCAIIFNTYNINGITYSEQKFIEHIHLYKKKIIILLGRYFDLKVL